MPVFHRSNLPTMLTAPFSIRQKSDTGRKAKLAGDQPSSVQPITLELPRRTRFDVAHTLHDLLHATETSDSQDKQAVSDSTFDKEDLHVRMIPGGPLGEVITKAIGVPLARAERGSETLPRFESGSGAQPDPAHSDDLSRQTPWLNLEVPPSTLAQLLPTSRAASPAPAQRLSGSWKRRSRAVHLDTASRTSSISAGAASAHVLSSPRLAFASAPATSDSLDYDTLLDAADVNLKLFDDLDSILAAPHNSPEYTLADSATSGVTTHMESAHGAGPSQMQTRAKRPPGRPRKYFFTEPASSNHAPPETGRSTTGKRPRTDEDRAALIASSSKLRRGPLLDALPAEASMTAIEAKWKYERKRGSQRKLAKKYPEGHELHSLVVSKKAEVAEARKFMRSFQENIDLHNAERSIQRQRAALKKTQQERDAQAQTSARTTKPLQSA